MYWHRSGIRRVVQCAVLLACALVAACSSQKSRVGSMLNLNTDFTLAVEADGHINPNNRGESSPVIFRLFELKSDDAFASADFIDLYERQRDALGDSLVRHRQLPRIAPGEIREYEMVLDGETRYVGILAEFYQYEDARYKVVVPVTANNVFRDRLRLRVDDNQLSIVH